MATSVGSFGDYVSNRAASDREYKREQVIRAALEKARRREVYGDYEAMAGLAREYLIPALLGEPTRGQLTRLADEIDDEKYHAQPILNLAGGATPTEDLVLGAIDALEAIAVHEDIVSKELRNYAPAKGVALRVGRLNKSPKYHAPEVQTISYHSGETKTLYHGETGEGKSTALSTDVADRWYATCRGEWHDGRYRRNDPIKIIDFLDTDSIENAVYDIPQQQDVLRQARIELGQPADFTDIEDFEAPDLEILMPLTERLGEEDIPVDQDSGDSPVTPFTIPASDLTKQSLKHFIAGSTEQQQAIIGMAYDRVESKKDDWRLQDLGEELLEIEGANDSFKERALNKIVELQRAGFIRDKSCPYRIDWDDIFRSPETMTSFTTKYMDETEQKLMVLMYLVYSLYWEREAREDLPSCVLVGRELHEIIPHAQENNGTEREQSLRNAMVGLMSYVLKKNRKQSMEFILDTQDITDLKRGPRKRFNRAVTFQSHEDAMEELFGKVVGDKSEWREYRRTIQSTTTGKGTVLGKTVPNDRDGTTFMANLEFAPPPWHVFDDDRHATGLHARVEYLNEDWESHDFETALPEEFQFEVDDVKDAVEEKQQEDDDGLTLEQKKEMHKKEARRRREMGETIRDIRDAIPNNPRTGNPYSKQTINKWTQDIYREQVESNAA